MLCEDDENLGMLLREYLQAKGFTTVLCPDGEVGYKEFNKNKFDIAVLDVMMPKKDGFTLAQEIRQTNSLPASTSLMISSSLPSYFSFMFCASKSKVASVL